VRLTLLTVALAGVCWINPGYAFVWEPACPPFVWCATGSEIQQVGEGENTLFYAIGGVNDGSECPDRCLIGKDGSVQRTCDTPQDFMTCAKLMNDAKNASEKPAPDTPAPDSPAPDTPAPDTPGPETPGAGNPAGNPSDGGSKTGKSEVFYNDNTMLFCPSGRRLTLGNVLAGERQWILTEPKKNPGC
jgi:hypothetical protein